LHPEKRGGTARDLGSTVCDEMGGEETKSLHSVGGKRGEKLHNQTPIVPYEIVGRADCNVSENNSAKSEGHAKSKGMKRKKKKKGP